MESRKDNLLKIIVEEYIVSASPVGSSLVVEKYLPELSSATIRNEMAQLEEEGLICQPHTSAGRIPTALGYRRYADKFIGEGKISEKDWKQLELLARELSADEAGIKTLAKALAEISDSTILIGFAASDVYCTGISNLFKQPEFAQPQLVFSMSEIIDHLDEVMGKIFYEIESEARIFLGSENPFGEMSSVILVKYDQAGVSGLIGILGPNRMDYRRNLGLLKFVQEIISNLK
jgi:transcriptional regulator of heat shock response